MRRLVLSDIHGGYKGLKQVFELANVDYENDRVIVIGDVCDGWPEVKECFEELLKLKNLIYILGNHDEWTIEYYKGDKQYVKSLWYTQGGKATLESFGESIPSPIMNILNNAKLYHIEDNMVFVHGGFDTMVPIESQDKKTLIWDRSLIKKKVETDYDKIFVGHTPTLMYDTMLPIRNGKLIMMDTGASYYGPLTIMDIDTEEFWQSDPVCGFYPGIKPRG